MNDLKIIINADDFGYSKEVNKKIILLIKHKKITSTTIIANSPFFQDAVNRILEIKDVSVGVHLNISEFQPITKQNIFLHRGIIDQSGNFNGKIRDKILSLKLVNAIEQEWIHQVDKVRKHGIAISHLDSHMHVHTIPILFHSLKKIQKKFKIRKVRLTTNIYKTEFKIAKDKYAKKVLWNFLLRNYYRTRTTTYFTEAEWFINEINRFKRISHKSVELMCHPGSNEKEYQSIIEGEWIKKAQFDIKMISYEDL